MNIDIMTFCESVHEYEGKLVIVGTFNTIMAEVFPMSPKDLSFALNVSFDKEDNPDKGFWKIYKKDTPDIELLNTEFPLNLPQRQPDRKPILNFYGSLVGMQIPESGTYISKIQIGDMVREIELYAIEIQPSE